MPDMVIITVWYLLFQPAMLPARPPAPAPADADEVRGRRGRAHQPRGEREVPPARRRQHRLGAAALQVRQFIGRFKILSPSSSTSRGFSRARQCTGEYTQVVFSRGSTAVVLTVFLSLCQFSGPDYPPSLTDLMARAANEV